MSMQFDIEDSAGAWLEIYKVPGQQGAFERWQVDASGVPWLTRAQLTELHTALGEMLGLGIPTPSSPLTASRPAGGAAKASRNLDRPAHGGYPGEVLVEQPDGSGGAARRV